MKKNYAALIIDLKGSRHYSDKERNQIQNSLIKFTDILNDCFKDKLKKKMDFSGGDEMQGLFLNASDAYAYYRLLVLCLYPIEFHMGLGVGTLDTEIENKGTTAQDGKVYHHARHAIDSSKISKSYSSLIYNGQDEANFDDYKTINSLICAEDYIIRKLTLIQDQIFLLSELVYPIIDCLKECYVDNPHMVYELIQAKNEFDQNNPKNVKELPLANIDYQLFKECRTKEEIFQNKTSEDSFYIVEGQERGIKQDLAVVLNSYHQKVDNYFKGGDIFLARNIALAIDLEMQKIK